MPLLVSYSYNDEMRWRWEGGDGGGGGGGGMVVEVEVGWWLNCVNHCLIIITWLNHYLMLVEMVVEVG